MVAGPRGEQQIQARLTRRRAELALIAISRFAHFDPLADERREYAELHSWLTARYVNVYGEYPSDPRARAITERTA